jgi:hypothetical protein
MKNLIFQHPVNEFSILIGRQRHNSVFPAISLVRKSASTQLFTTVRCVWRFGSMQRECGTIPSFQRLVW